MSEVEATGEQSTENVEQNVPTITDLLEMSPDDAATVLQSIPDTKIFKMGEQVGREAISYNMFGGISAIVAGLNGDANAVEKTAEKNQLHALNLKTLEELFFAEYERRREERRNQRTT